MSRPNEVLKQARIHVLGMTQAQVSEAFGVARTTYNMWETGQRPILAHRWTAFKKHFGFNEEDVFRATPRRLKYDAKGYPITSDDWETMQFDSGNSGAAYGAMCARLHALEGQEYASRCVERHRLLSHGRATPEELEDVRREAEQFVASQEMV